MAIDYIGLLDYLEKNKEMPYANPEAAGNAAEKARLLEMKRKGQAALASLKQIVDLCQTVTKLDYCEPMSWLDGSRTKTRRYLWAQMKYKDYAKNPVSVSLSVETKADIAYFRVSLDIKDDATDKAGIQQFHSHMELPLNTQAGLIYVTGINQWGHPDKIDEDAAVIRMKLEKGDYRKVQVCKNIPQKPDQTDAYFEQEILSAVNALIPYYEHVLGVQKETQVKKSVNTDKQKFDKNMILYGPPGTGKTYHTAIYAVAICDGKPLEEVKALPYSEIMDRYAQLKGAGRVAFTTFHQSYGYEEFIEGIKPVVDGMDSTLRYKIESGIFKKFCEKADIAGNTPVPYTGKVWAVRSRAGDSDVAFDYEAYLYQQEVILVENVEDHNRQCNYLTDMVKGDLIVLGRDYRISAIGVVVDDTPEKTEKKPFYWQRSVKWLVKNLNMTFDDLSMPGRVFSNFAIAKSPIGFEKARRLIHSQPYVFIIDEINRGNIAKIFGELITLIENTKRKGMPEGASAILPYSGEAFSVPSNVYIIGAMNTADRSIALMDTALRRRFRFVEMMPDSKILSGVVIDGLDVAKMLDVINERIAFLYDREHTIGHAFFTGLLKPENRSVEVLGEIFGKSVIPLLQEYFYEDYQKIQLVLGDNAKSDSDRKFIKDAKVIAKNIFVGSAEDLVDLPDKKFGINPKAFCDIDSYKEIAPGFLGG